MVDSSSSSATAGAPGAVSVLPRSILAGLEKLGVDTAAVLKRCGPGVLDPALGPAPRAPTYALWEAAVAVTGESGLGLRLAERARAEDYGLMGKLVPSSFTLGEALLH